MLLAKDFLVEKNKLMNDEIFPVYWQHFAASIIFSVIFPVGPLIIEMLISGSVTDSTMLISAIMYVSAIIVQSSSVATFSAGFVSAIGLAIPYGISLETGNVNLIVYYMAIAAMLIFAIAHGFQRYTIHVTLREDFLTFRSNK